MGPLDDYSNVNNRFNNSYMPSFTHNREWDVELITNLAPPQHVLAILAIQLQFQQGIPNQAI